MMVLISQDLSRELTNIVKQIATTAEHEEFKTKKTL